jgi:5-(carboxyamino)imidazole ribonucleotide synthase
MNDVLAMENAYVHIYGKSNTAPGRKMGHVTILERDKSDLMRKAGKVKHSFRVIS